MGLSWTYVGLKMGQDRPRWAKMQPRWAKTWVKMGQDEAKTGPEWAKMGPRWGQDEPKMRPKERSRGLCWWLVRLLGARTVFLKNGVSPRR